MAKAGEEIYTISKGISLFSLMLKQVGLALKEADSVHSQEAVETARQITSQCTLVFDEIQTMVDRCQTRDGNGYMKVPNLVQRIKWCFRKGRVEYLVASLDSLKLSLSLMLQVLDLGKTMTSRPESRPSMIREQEISQGRLEVQNMVITRYYTVVQLHQLEQALEEVPDYDDTEILPPYESQPSSPQSERLAISSSKPDMTQPKALIKMPTGPLADIDKTIPPTAEAPVQIMSTSYLVVNQLLEKWTRIPHPEAPLSPVTTPNGHSSFREERHYPTEYRPYVREGQPQNSTRDSGLGSARDAGLGAAVREERQYPAEYHHHAREDAPSVIPRDGAVGNTGNVAGLSTAADGHGRYIEDRHRLYLEDGKPRSRRSKKGRSHLQPQVESDSDDSEEVRHRKKSPRHSHRVLESDEDSSTSDFESEEEREMRRHKHRSSGEHTRGDSDVSSRSFNRPEMPAFRRPNIGPNLHGYPNPHGQPNINYGGPPPSVPQPIPILNQQQYRPHSMSSPPVASPSGYPQYPPLQAHRSYQGPGQYPQQQHLRPPPDQQYQRPPSPNKRTSPRHHSREKSETSVSDKKGAVKAAAKGTGWAVGLATLLEGLDGL
ncbi:hypothetical protein MMC08_002180 [Hypocenomyce scalaris]|nr:hypothetical protein [Hypocenomyce scalaris]